MAAEFKLFEWYCPRIVSSGVFCISGDKIFVSATRILADYLVPTE
jgi:hypothetical protein